jgi:urate oxidase
LPTLTQRLPQRAELTGKRLRSYRRPVDRVNSASAGELAEQLFRGLAVPRWAAGVVAGRPNRDVEALCQRADELTAGLSDEYTTLPETTDRILATAVTARWRYAHHEVDWAASFESVRSIMLSTFASLHSLALQQTLYAMAEAALTAHDEIAEVRLTLPNKHHFAVDLSPFGLDNPNEVFFAADRPYGLIEGAVLRDDAPDPGLAWDISV